MLIFEFEQSYECGWCGSATDAKGNPTGNRGERNASKVNGKCCPGGSRDYQSQQSHELEVDEAEKFPSVKTYSVEELADKHGVPTRQIWGQLHKGIQVELEHTTDPSVAKEIALDHIAEFPFYYNRLEQVEEGEMIPFPKNSLAIDTDGPYDWSNIGQDIANLDQISPDDKAKYGHAGADTIIIASSPEEQDMYTKKITQKTGLATVKNPSSTDMELDAKKSGNRDIKEVGGVGKITAQNSTPDVKAGETGRQANKFNLKVDSKGTPKLLRP